MKNIISTVLFFGMSGQMLGMNQQTFGKNKPLTHKLIHEMIYHFDPHRELSVSPTALSEAIAMANRAVKHKDVGIREDGLKLFHALIDDLPRHEQAHEPAMKAAIAAIGDPNSCLRIQALKNFITLSGRRKYVPAYAPAMKAAQMVVGDANIDVREKGLQLYIALVSSSYEPAYEAAIKATQMAIDDQANWGVIRACSHLFDALFKAKYVDAYPAAEAVAHIATAHERPEVCRGGLHLYAELVEKNYKPAYATAAKAAQAASISTDTIVHGVGLALLKKLVDANYMEANELLKEATKESQKQ